MNTRRDILKGIMGAIAAPFVAKAALRPTGPETVSAPVPPKGSSHATGVTETCASGVVTVTAGGPYKQGEHMFIGNDGKLWVTYSTLYAGEDMRARQP